MSEAKPRILSLSDLIFGLALSISALTLIGHQPTTAEEFFASLALYGFSFLILINVWNRYTSMASVVPIESKGMVRLNMLLLFLVAVEPYLFNLLILQTVPGASLGQEVSTYYALDIGGMNVVLAYFAHLLTVEEKNLIPRELVSRFKVTRNSLLVGGLIFIASAAPIFWTIGVEQTPLRVVIWLLAMPGLWFSRIFGGRG